MIVAPSRFAVTGGGGGGAALSLASLTHTYKPGATSHAMNLPASIAAGDLLLMLTQHTTTATITPPAGWTLEATHYYSGSAGNLSLFTRIADGTEGATATFTLSASTPLSSLCARIPGGTDVETAYVRIASATTSDPATLTPTWGSRNTVWLVIGHGYYDRTVTAYPLPDNNAEYSGGVLGHYLYVATKQETAASQDPAVMTFDAGQYGVLFTVGVRGA